MIADRALDAVKAWIESNAGAHTEINDLSIVMRDSDAVKTYPLLTLNDTAAQEHPTLRGVMHPLTIDAILETVPNSEDDAASATDTTTHQEYTSALYAILANTDGAVPFMDARSGISVFDSRGEEGTTDEADGRRSTRFEIRLTCCLQ